MRSMMAFVVVAFFTVSSTAQAQFASGNRFEPLDVFQLERAVDPQIAPDGRRIVYVRAGSDITTDRGTSALWLIATDGSGHRPLVTDRRVGSPRWSPTGDRLAYVVSGEDGAEIYVRWMDTGQEARVTNLTESPGGLSWSPDGSHIAFSMFVPEAGQTSFAQMPRQPEGADWGPAIKVIDRLNYRADGQGYLRDGHRHLFVVPAEGGTARQLTAGPYDHGGTPAWTPDSEYLVFSANRHPGADTLPRNSEVYALRLADGSITALTDRFGPDGSPAVSPDGRRIAYTGFDDRLQGYQVSGLYVMNRDGSDTRRLAADLDRDVDDPVWARDGRGIYFQYGDRGTGKVAYVDLNGRVQEIVSGAGGLSLGRPYVAGQYTVADDGTVAYTRGTAAHPADLGVARRGRDPVRLTRLNDDLFGHKQLGRVEEIWWESSHDGRRIQGWIITPPDFDPSRRYPMVLEIHGGPFAMYGDVFSAELQLYAAAGYVVLYTNPRGSTGYGEEFGNLIHHAYPGNDYDDLMSGVDAVIERGYVDPNQLFVTGGSGGGVLSAWIVGKTERFAAAAVQKPVINWYSFVLYADAPMFFWRYWFPGPPWEHQEHYMARSPISLVGNVTTPTMLITGEEDYRTPMPETEQYYAALRIRGIETAMVRVPDASHGIASRPSNLIAKVQHILGWFGKYRMGT